MDLLILLARPTRGMIELADHSGTYTVPMKDNVTEAGLLAGRRPELPPAIHPYIQASSKPESEVIPLFEPVAVVRQLDSPR